MAQRSKKDHIVACALPLFLTNGFKGTSIDQVVKESTVSKPTVYNHFPNKAALMLAVIEQWVATHQPEVPTTKDLQSLERIINKQWLTQDTVNFYALVIGEGRRFPAAKNNFWEHFDKPWRTALINASTQTSSLPASPIEMFIDQQLLIRLKQL
jgi:AcrR family transcriptional regulator